MITQPPAAAPPALPRGIRLHNPGNIQHSATVWVGQADAQPDARFVAFAEPYFGIRAMMVGLRTHWHRGAHTLAALVAIWAPPVENDTPAYVANVCRWLTGALNRPIAADTALDLADPATLVALAQSITKEEQGHPPAGMPPCWYPDALFRQAATAVIAGH